MARFATRKTESVTAMKTKTVNLAGGEAYKQTPKTELVSLLLTNMVKDQFYRPTEDTLARMRELIGGIKDKKFIAKALIYARRECGMRSITHVGAAELAQYASGQEWGARFYNRVINRVDDISEIVAYWLNTLKGKPTLTSAMKHGFSGAFARFNAYQLAKYRGEGKDPSLVDVVNMVHPIATNSEQNMVEVDRKEYIKVLKTKKGVDAKSKLRRVSKLTGKTVKIHALEALMIGMLISKDTWESKLTQAGQKAETEEQKEEFKADAWKELISERKLGYFALLRNLRNIKEQAPEMLGDALEMLVDKKLIKKSLVLPYRFATAYDQFDSSDASDRKIMSALSKALDISCENVVEFAEGKTCVMIDVSGSMSAMPYSHRSDGRTENGTPGKQAALFGSILAKANNADIVLFDGSARMLSYDLDMPVLKLSAHIQTYMRGGSTSFHAPFKLITGNKRKYDRIIILSDMQGWMLGVDGYNGCGSWSDGYGYSYSQTNLPKLTLETYKKMTGSDPYVYSFDVAGYGTMQFPQDKVFCLAGLSEKVFSVMQLLEKDPNAILAEIEKVEL
jgi:60 kDa SS-A/Ro ribonucleoprotein